MKASKKILAFLLAAAFMITLLPAGALAVGTTVDVTDNVSAISTGGKVSDTPAEIRTLPNSKMVTFDEDATLQFAPSQGARSDGWHAGVKIIVPTGSGTDPTYTKIEQWWTDAGTTASGNSATWKTPDLAFNNFEDGVDSASGQKFLTIWGLVQPSYLTGRYAGGTSLYYRYKFNWDAAGDYDQELIICVKKGVQLSPDNAALKVAITTDDGSLYEGHSGLQSTITRVGEAKTNFALYQNVTENAAFTAGEKTLDLNGKTLTGTVTVSGGSLAIKAENGGVVTGNVTVSAGSLAIQGGKYQGAISTSGSGKVTITGGYFVTEPSADYLGSVDGKQLECVELESTAPEYGEGYRYTVGKTENTAGILPSVGDCNVESTVGSGVTQDVIDAVQTITAGSSQEMEEKAQAEAKAITADQKNTYLTEARKTIPGANYLHVQTYLSVSITKYDDTLKDNLELEIAPKFRVIASSSADVDKIVLKKDDPGLNAVVITKTEQTLPQITGESQVSVKLPTGFYTGSETVYVYHNGAACKNVYVDSNPAADTLHFTTDGFSPFRISKAGPAATITKGGQTVSYSTFAAAVSAAEDGDEIVLAELPTLDKPIIINNKNVTLKSGVPGSNIDDQYVITNGTKEVDAATGAITVKKPASPVVSGGVSVGGGFIDVPLESWYTDAVNWAVASGIVYGTTGTTFSPKKECTRAEAVTLLWRAAGSPEPNTTVCPFADVKESNYYYKAVLWAVENDITAGVTPGLFGSDWTCTRAHIVTFLWRWASRKQISMTNPFTDVPVGGYYEAPVLWALSKGITVGVTADFFGSKMACNRAHLVTFLYRYMGK